MSMDNNSTSSLSNRPSDGTRRADNDRPADQPREAPPKEQVDRFRQLMQHGREEGRAGLQEKQEQRGPHDLGRHAAGAAARHAEQEAALRGLSGQRGSHEGTDNNGMGANSLEAADVLAMMQAQAALRDGAAMAPTQAPTPMASSRSLAEMLERHVRKLAVDDAAATRDFLKDSPVGYPILVDDPQTGGDLSKMYGNNRSVLPYTVLIGRDGRILAQHFGSFSETALEDWLRPHL